MSAFLCGVCFLFLMLCFLCGACPCGLRIVQRYAAVFFRGCPARSTARAWSDSRRTSPGTAVESYVFQHWFSVTLEATPGTVAENLVSLDWYKVLPGVVHGSSRETYPKRLTGDTLMLRCSHIRKGKRSRMSWIFVFFLWRIWQRGHDYCKALVCHRGLRFPGILPSWWLRPLSTWLTVSPLARDRSTFDNSAALDSSFLSPSDGIPPGLQKGYFWVSYLW